MRRTATPTLRGTAPAWIEVDAAAVEHNVRAFGAVLPRACRIVAVVKANAYGHGAVPVARAALRAGASLLAVANVAEGAELRAHGVAAPILVVGPVTPEQAREAVELALLPGLGGRDVARAFAAAVRPGRPFPVHVEVDTGMHRHGVPAAEAGAFVQELAVRGRLDVVGLFTHFHAVDARGVPAMRQQLVRFRDVVASLRSTGALLQHAANTLAALVCPEAHLDAVRLGGGLYGFDPLRGRGPVRLRPALSLKARIVGLRDAEQGASVGYGGTFVCTRPSRLALLPIGYADGLARAFWHGAPVLVRGRTAPIVGLVSMNQTIVDVTGVEGAQCGDEVVLLGEQDGARVVAEERVPAGGSVYEVTSLLRRDLPRVVCEP